MPRRDPGEAPNIDDAQLERKDNLQIRVYEVITPLFGGGVIPGEADPITTVRASEIRGQLRFWWRACRAASFQSIEEMKQQEDALWGAAVARNKIGGPSSVKLHITVTNKGSEVAPFKIEPNPRGGCRVAVNPASGVPTYAAFPLQPSNEEVEKHGMQTPCKKVRKGVQFQLTLSFPEEHTRDVEAALWAWETFGGVGARTRRGFGALKLVIVNNRPQQLPQANNVKGWLEEHLNQHVSEGIAPLDVPHLLKDGKQSFAFTDAFSRVEQCWDNLIETLRKFRQYRPEKIVEGKAFGQRQTQSAGCTMGCEKSQPEGDQTTPIDRFPRAAFGLPIIFHFKDHSDLLDMTLQGADKDVTRLASPLLLRPLACTNGKFAGLAILLTGSRGDIETPRTVEEKPARGTSRDRTHGSGSPDHFGSEREYRCA